MPDPYAEPETLVPCCVHLRTKMQGCCWTDACAAPGMIRDSETATYWCEKTSESFGCDDRPATPQACQPGRSCYERPA